MAHVPSSNDWFLATDVKIQPLFCRWPAWPHLIAPAQAAMNLAFRYLPSLQSFVDNPSIHVSAANHPAMFGGPFVALGAADVPRVVELIALTQRKCGTLLEFAQQYRKLDQRLQREAKGYRLDEFYLDVVVHGGPDRCHQHAGDSDPRPVAADRDDRDDGEI